MEGRKIYGLLGLAEKAGQLVSGEFSCEKMLKIGKAKLLILAKDASENSLKKFRDKAESHRLPLLVFGTKEELGKAIGKQERSCLALLDQGFAAAITKEMAKETSAQEATDREK